MGHAGAIISGGKGTAGTNIGLLKSFNLGTSSTLSTGDDGTSVSHSSARGSGHSGNKGDNWLSIWSRVVLNQIISCLLLGLATDFSNHDDTGGFGVVDENLEAVNEVGTIERVSTNANTQGLAKADSTGLMDGLIGESARPADNTNAAFLVDVSGHNANLARTRSNNSRAVGSDQS